MSVKKITAKRMPQIQLEVSHRYSWKCPTDKTGSVIQKQLKVSYRYNWKCRTDTAGSVPQIQLEVSHRYSWKCPTNTTGSVIQKKLEVSYSYRKCFQDTLKQSKPLHGNRFRANSLDIYKLFNFQRELKKFL